MTVLSMTVGMSITGTETLGVNVPAAASSKRQVTHDQLNLAQSFNNGTVPPGSEIVVVSSNLVAGAYTLDLTQAPGTGGRVINLTGLRLRAIKLANNATVNDLIIAHAGTDVYGWNDGSGETIGPTDVYMRLFRGTAWNVDVSSSAKKIYLTGVGTDPFTLEMLFG